jgi:sigma-B regulation protein RsbU (phosphoserine phosphatase)
MMPDEGETKAARSDYVEMLGGVMDAFAQSRDLNATLHAVLLRITEAMDAESASLFLLEGSLGDSRARLVCQASVGPAPITGLSLPATAGIAGRAVATNTTQLVGDTRLDPDFVAPPSVGSGYQVRSLLCAPLSFRGQRLGVVEVINRRRPRLFESGPRHSRQAHRKRALFDGRDREALEALAAAASLAISNAQMAQSLLEQERLRRDLDLAVAVQRSLLPAPQPADSAIHGLAIPARGVSGDFYDILPLTGGRVAFALADVSGKGMNAALIMVKAATLFRSLGRTVHEPGLLLGRIQAELCETMTLGMFVTMVVGVYDSQRRAVTFANAGHEPPLLRRRDGRYAVFAAEDPPLGVIGRLEDGRYRETRLALNGGSLYFYTDGCTEGRLLDGSALGADGLRRLISQHAGDPAPARLAAVAQALTQAGDELRDDVTLLVVEDRGITRPPERRRRQASVLVEQVIPASVAQLRVVRRLVDAAARQAGAAADWARDLALAVDEGCQNIIRHGYQGVADGRIQLRVRRLRDRMVVELVDFAPPVDQDKCKGRRLEDLRPGGLGTLFMHALTDSVRFLRPPPGAGNRLMLSKLLPERRRKKSR